MKRSLFLLGTFAVVAIFASAGLVAADDQKVPPADDQAMRQLTAEIGLLKATTERQQKEIAALKNELESLKEQLKQLREICLKAGIGLPAPAKLEAAKPKAAKIYGPDDFPTREKVEGQQFFASFALAREVGPSKEREGMMLVLLNGGLEEGQHFCIIRAYLPPAEVEGIIKGDYYNVTGTIDGTDGGTTIELIKPTFHFVQPPPGPARQGHAAVGGE